MQLFKRSLHSTLILLITLIANCSYAQPDVGRATSESDRFMNKNKEIETKMRRIPQKPVIEMEKTAVGEERFLVEKIRLVGCRRLSAETFAGLLKNYENTELTMQDLKALSRAIENEYAARGMEVAVIVPLEEMKDQTVTLHVLEDDYVRY